MPRKHVLLRASEVARHDIPFVQRLNPRSQFSLAPLARLAGLERTGLSLGRIPPGGEAFAYHAHLREEEWVYIVSGRARARVDGEDLELSPGDFLAFPAPQVPHLLTNPFDAECVYLMGGERTPAPDVLEYPELGKRYVLVREAGRVAFHEVGPAEYPFGRAGAPPAAGRWRVLGTKGCGSAIVEAALATAGIPYDREEHDYATPEGRAALAALNPLAQVPTVVLPDGTVMTESAAIVLHADGLAPGLMPSASDPRRAEALRWLTFLVAAIYPTFTFGDDPKRWSCGDELRRATDEGRKGLWQHVEAAARGPWFLGHVFSALDLYIGVMTHWRPGRAWFADHCPKLAAIAAAVDRDPRLAPVWAANF